MQLFSGTRPIATITGIVYALIGLALTGGGAWLAALGGSLFYVAAGLGILVTGALLAAGRRSALGVYAAVLIGTLIWAVAMSFIHSASGCSRPGLRAISITAEYRPGRPSGCRSGAEWSPAPGCCWRVLAPPIMRSMA